VEAALNRCNESVSQSINAGKGLASQFPRPSVPPREVVRCQSCSLVQFRTMSDLCRRCHRPLSPELELDSGEAPSVDVSEDASDRRMEASPEAPGSFPGQPPLSPEPQIGSAVRRLRTAQGVSQGELGRMVGLRRTYLSRVENDHVMPGPRIVSQIARALGVGICDLFLPQPKRGSNGVVLREPACARLVEIFSELPPREMAAIVSAARQMRAAGPARPPIKSAAPLSRSAGRFRDAGAQQQLR